MRQHVWGAKESQLFFDLQPEVILNSIEDALDVKCTGRSMQLNSMENRVYDIEIELDETPENPSDSFVIAKFYRPGRWSFEQIEEEHEFLAELVANDIPAVAPLANDKNESVFTCKKTGLFFAVFPKIGGRSPDELDDNQMQQVGRLLARMHLVGERHAARHRLTMSPETYGLGSLEFLLENDILPPEIRAGYEQVTRDICEISIPMFAKYPFHRLHGDCHMGNLLQRGKSLFWVDFDDMIMGPSVQDIWLLIPGRDEYAKAKQKTLIESYEIMRSFPFSSLELIEPLRSLRFMLFSAWIGKRWNDPAFKRAFPYFGTQKYWQEQLQDLREQLALIREL